MNKNWNKKLYKVYVNLFNQVKKKMVDILAETETIDRLYRYNKLYDFEEWLTKEIKRVGNKEIKLIDEELESAYTKGLSTGTGTTVGISLQHFKTAHNVRDVWCSDGKQWSDRIWSHKQVLKDNLISGLIDCVSRGATTDDLVRDIESTCKTSLYCSQRIVRTELQVQYIIGTLDKFKADGIEYYRISEPDDDRTCDKCKEMSGKTFPVKDANIGINCPVFHPNCRGTIEAVITIRKK